MLASIGGEVVGMCLSVVAKIAQGHVLLLGEVIVDRTEHSVADVRGKIGGP
jgi:hypothetical protein